MNKYEDHLARGFDTKAALSLDEWKAKLREVWPDVEFTVEDGTGNTYGDIGQWAAHIGPDMQEDVVGVYCPGDFCWLYPATDADSVDYPTKE